jgi:crossover junction endodeoxyribonuclease RuvC
MIILGIDPGTATTGFGVIKKLTNGKFEVLDFGVLATAKTKSDSERLLEIYQDLGHIIKKYKPQVACVEKLFFTTNQKTAMTVSQARGVVLLLLTQNGIPTQEFTPLQVKSIICGYGKARKDQVQRVVKSSLGLKSIPKPDDAADALAIAMCAAKI